MKRELSFKYFTYVCVYIMRLAIIFLLTFYFLNHLQDTGFFKRNLKPTKKISLNIEYAGTGEDSPVPVCFI